MIHPSAIVEKGAELGRGVRIGPFAYIGPHVKLGDGCEVHTRATLVGHTTVGEGCVFFPNCVIGEVPQDLKYDGEHCETIVGNDNHFRELVTVHAGTGVGGGVTRIGDHNRFLVCVHIAHDSSVGNHVVIANNTQMAGHCHIEDCVTMGGHIGIHHFVTVGRYAMVGGLSRITADCPPYLITQGYRPSPRGVNTAGLKRWRLPEQEITALTKAYRRLYAKSANRDQPFAQRLADVQCAADNSPGVAYLCEFVHRTMTLGRRGRYLESKRRDQPADNRKFYEKKMVGETTS